jgi:cell pole-organizing protein PopZ
MPQTQLQPEPSMEEILASIRRIISEEESGDAPPDDAVLDLTQRAPAEEAVAAPGTEDLLVFDAPQQAPPAPPARRAAQPPPYAQPMAPQAAAPAEPIISRPAAAAASGALTKLASALRIAESSGQTLEGMVREMLKPMLKEWLDENLPAIVEARVEAELERIARLAR